MRYEHDKAYGKSGKMFKRKCNTCHRTKGVVAFPVPDEWDRRDKSRCIDCHEARACQ